MDNTDNNDGQEKPKRKRTRKGGNENPTNLAHYSGIEKDVLNLTKTKMKILLITVNLYPDLMETVSFVLQAFKDAGAMYSLPEDSPHSKDC